VKEVRVFNDGVNNSVQDRRMNISETEIEIEIPNEEDDTSCNLTRKE
jgi:hypothetical protein